MPQFHTTDSNGISIINPSETEIKKLIAQLDSSEIEDSDHPDILLVNDDNGWGITLYPSGIAVLENLEALNEPQRYLENVTREKASELWISLAHGHIAPIEGLPWRVLED